MAHTVENITYGLGGYDPSKPNNNVVEVELVWVSDEEEAQTAKIERQENVLDELDQLRAEIGTLHRRLDRGGIAK